MKTCFNTFAGFTGRIMPDIEEVVSLLSRAGLDGIEINAEIGPFGPKNRHAGLDISNEQIEKTRKICEHYNLEVSSIAAHFSFISPDEKEREGAIREHKRCIDQGIILGTKVVHGYSGSPMKRIDDQGEEELWQIFKKGCLEVLDYAKDKGIEFAIEPVITHLVHSYESAKRMFEVIDRDDLYLNLDPCHLYLSGPSDAPQKVIEEFGEKIKYVHIHDAVGADSFKWERFKKREENRGITGFKWGKLREKKESAWENMRPVSLGEIDWLDIIRRLKEKGFDGFLSYDYGPRPEGYLHSYRYHIEILAKAYNDFIKGIINRV